MYSKSLFLPIQIRPPVKALLDTSGLFPWDFFNNVSGLLYGQGNVFPGIGRIRFRPWKYQEENAMSNERVVPETKGVTVKLLATVDLGPEIEGMAGRQLRMRMVTIEPGGVFGPIHDHKGRPGTVYILQGTITDHREGVATDYGPGVGWPEDRNTTHWLENRGTIPAVEISVDIVRQE